MIVCGMTEECLQRMTNPTGERVVDVKTRNAADAGPCGHGHHEEEKKPSVRRGKGEEGRQSVYRACAMDDVRKRADVTTIMLGSVRATHSTGLKGREEERATRTARTMRMVIALLVPC